MMPLMAKWGWLKPAFACAAAALLSLGAAACVADVDDGEEISESELESIAGGFDHAWDAAERAESGDSDGDDLNSPLNWIELENEHEPDPIPWMDDKGQDGHDKGGDQSGDNKP